MPQARFLCQLHADAGGIYTHAAHMRQHRIPVQHRRLFVEGCILHFYHAAGDAAVSVRFHQIKNGQVILSANIHARVVFLARVKVQLPPLITHHAACVNQVIADERAGVIRRFTHELLPE